MIYRLAPLTMFAAVLIPWSELQAISISQVDHFDAGGTHNWQEGAPSPNPPVNVATGGNPDGYLENLASGGGGSGSKLAMFNQAQWAGDYLAAGVSAIQMDLQNFSPLLSLDIRIAFGSGTGGGGSWFASTTPVTLPAGAWQSATFGLSESDLTQVTGADSLQDVLANVAELRIISASAGPNFQGDSVNAVLGVDNIRAVPEPATMFLGLISCVLVATRIRAR